MEERNQEIESTERQYLGYTCGLIYPVSGTKQEQAESRTVKEFIEEFRLFLPERITQEVVAPGINARLIDRSLWTYPLANFLQWINSHYSIEERRFSLESYNKEVLQGVIDGGTKHIKQRSG